MISVLMILQGCVSVEKRIQIAQNLALENQYALQVYRSNDFSLAAFIPATADLKDQSISLLHVVIEGDGYAWVDRSQPSDNPTPKDPTGLRIALSSRFPPARPVYLARPCQYVWDDKCAPAYWTDRRFDPAVMRSYKEVLDQLRTQTSAEKLHLVGYSGGAYIALYMAAMRDDVTEVTTLAGLVDPPVWTAYHEVTPLVLPASTESLIKNSRHAKFVHYCGADDEIIPCALTEKLRQKAQYLGAKNHEIRRVQNANHYDIWKK